MPSATPPIRSIDSDIYDAIIIGGGPSALAVAARLREPLPSALYTDVEHQRFHWLKKHGSHIRTRDHSSLKPCDTARPFGNDLRLLVLDRSGDEFLSAWKALFKAFDISHLRSPMFFHPDPKDVDSLLAYACLNGRDGELKEIGGVVGKERSKHQEKRKRSRLLPKNDVNERGQPVSHALIMILLTLTRAAGLFYPLVHAFHRLLPGSHISIRPPVYNSQS